MTNLLGRSGYIGSARNYLSKLLACERLLDARDSLTHLAEFIPAALQFARLRPPPGIYNCTNPGSVTAREIAAFLSASIAPAASSAFSPEQPTSSCKPPPSSRAPIVCLIRLNLPPSA